MCACVCVCVRVCGVCVQLCCVWSAACSDVHQVSLLLFKVYVQVLPSSSNLLRSTTPETARPFTQVSFKFRETCFFAGQSVVRVFFFVDAKIVPWNSHDLHLKFKQLTPFFTKGQKSHASTQFEHCQITKMLF